MRPVLGLGSNIVARPPGTPPCCSRTLKIAQRQPNKGGPPRATARVWTVERFGICLTLLIRCCQAGPLRAPCALLLALPS
jgi:hypothetical protein